jgi:DNA gyrase subunit A
MSKEDNKSINSLAKISLKDLVQQEYRIYQLYTLMDRALPYLRDGLKPSQRRILYTLFKNQNKGLLKVSSATGLVLSLHPHGPASVESAIVNLAQDYTFSNNYPLVEKKGYFGERMENQPAASRYIECKLSSISKFLLFDDMNQVNMIPNYDERMLEPQSLLPKLPLMLLNGAEGIATGYSCMIPSFHHKDIIDSMIEFVKTGKAKKIKAWVDNYKENIKYDKDRNRYIFNMKIERLKKKTGGFGYYITELPRGYNATKINNHLNKLVDDDFIKDYIDSTVKNNVMIELVFKKGSRISLENVISRVSATSTLVPNYTLISDEGVEVFVTPESIIEIFTTQRLGVVKRRYELLLEDAKNRIQKNNEIIRFIKEKHYDIAQKKQDKADYLKYLKSKKFVHYDYLAEMSIYRMTKDEVLKRALMIKEDSPKIKEFEGIIKSKKKIQDKLFEELIEVKEVLSNFLRDKNRK